MEIHEDILLNSHFVNKMSIGGELGWYSQGYNASTGYQWTCRPDNSGVYEMVEEVVLHPSTDAVGVPGMIVWKFKAVRDGKGSVLFELTPPGATEPVEKIVVTIEAKK